MYDAPCTSQPDTKRDMAGKEKISQQSLADLHANLDREAGEEIELKRKRKREKRIERKREKSSITFNKLKAKAAAVNEAVKQINSHQGCSPRIKASNMGCRTLQQFTRTHLGL